MQQQWRELWTEPAQRDGDFFLPDFCDIRVVFVVVLAAELFALVLTLAAPYSGLIWQRFGLISMFVQWVVLTATALLCRLRPCLKQQSVAQASLWSMLTILLLTAATTLLLDWLFQRDSYRSWRETGSPLFWGNLGIACIIGTVLLRYFYLQQQFRLRLRREAEARIQALQARIHPHFLFNTMNILASLTRTDPQLAERVVVDLSALFRASLNFSGNQVTLAQELDLCTRYLRIEQLRLGSRLQFDIDVDETQQHWPLPLLSLQPLIENAVFHGVQARIAGGLVSVHAYESDAQRIIEVRNPLPETDRLHSGHGVALANIRERLQVLYGHQASLRCTEEDGDYVARLILPGAAR